MNRHIEAVSHNLRLAREQRNLSLDQLAALTGVSKSMLRQIEKGKSSPTIATIWKIANGLRISFSALLRQQEIEAEVKPFRGGTPLTDMSETYRIFPMVSFDPHEPFETYFLEMDPGTIFSGEPHQGNIYEYIFITQGTLKVEVEKQIFTVNEKEFLKFDASYPHIYKCVGDKMLEAILQLSYLE